MNEFETRLAAIEPAALQATGVSTLELNLGLRCNMRCAHCHQSASPDRPETMTEEVFAAAMGVARRVRPSIVDLTGGAPELHPRIRAHVTALRAEGFQVQLRTNLTALCEPGSADLPGLLASLGVRILCSLPSWEPGPTDRQRGEGSFETSIAMLRKLNALGYGSGDGLRLDIACNPEGAALPAGQVAAERRFREELGRGHGIRFDSLLALTNVPVGRAGQALAAAGTRQGYIAALRAAFNPGTVPHLACRRTLVVAWDGSLWDCDFNLGAGLPFRSAPRSVFEFDESCLVRRIAFGPHCFACTALAGSS
jgi:radical SAM/Cys-rich protein